MGVSGCALRGLVCLYKEQTAYIGYLWQAVRPAVRRWRDLAVSSKGVLKSLSSARSARECDRVRVSKRAREKESRGRDRDRRGRARKCTASAAPPARDYALGVPLLVHHSGTYCPMTAVAPDDVLHHGRQAESIPLHIG